MRLVAAFRNGTFDKLIRSVLLGIPMVMLYYLDAWYTWRFEWLERPYHLRIWNVPAGCLPTEHWPLLDWVFASLFLFIVQFVFGKLRKVLRWLMEGPKPMRASTARDLN